MNVNWHIPSGYVNLWAKVTNESHKNWSLTKNDANLPPELAGLNRSTIRERTDSAVVLRANAEPGYRECSRNWNSHDPKACNGTGPSNIMVIHSLIKIIILAKDQFLL